ncbi:MAG: hypothetical protein K8T10_13570 [Candidatus Eremiobacteraeota bacterium]|nr:hypothetical protein [Candidatus Eremiobacteraeota bacterium]
MKKLTVMLISALIAFLLMTGLSHAKEKITENNGYFYYNGGQTGIKLGKAFGRGLAKSAIIRKNSDGATVIRMNYSEEGSDFRNCYIIKNDKLVFSFDPYSQKSFRDVYFSLFDSIIKKKWPSPDYSPGKYIRYEGAVNVTGSRVLMFTANFYRTSRTSNEYTYQIATDYFDYEKNETISGKVWIGRTKTPTFKFVEERLRRTNDMLGQ